MDRENEERDESPEYVPRDERSFYWAGAIDSGKDNTLDSTDKIGLQDGISPDYFLS